MDAWYLSMSTKMEKFEGDCASASSKNLHSTKSGSKKRKKKKKSKPKHHQKFTVGTGRKLGNMSSFTEAYSKAAAWQYKHEIAYWKAKAMALEFENRVLHDIIKKNHNRGPVENIESETYDTSENEDDMESDHPDEDNPEHVEVSEAYIEFLTANAKYREDARLERERLKQKENEQENSVELMESMPSNDKNDSQDDLKKLYGKQWQRINALEMSLQCKFDLELDKSKPNYWPNIPFNFNYC